MSVSRIAVALTLATIGFLAPAPPALAAQGDLKCTLALVLNFTPTLTISQATATSSGTGLMVNCVSSNGVYPGLNNAVVTSWGAATLTAAPGKPLDCKAFSVRIIGNGTWRWSNGETSQFSFIVDTDPAHLTADAVATSGPLVHDTGAAIGAFNANTDCPSNGLSSLTIPAAEATFA